MFYEQIDQSALFAGFFGLLGLWIAYGAVNSYMVSVYWFTVIASVILVASIVSVVRTAKTWYLYEHLLNQQFDLRLRRGESEPYTPIPSPDANPKKWREFVRNLEEPKSKHKPRG